MGHALCRQLPALQALPIALPSYGVSLALGCVASSPGCFSATPEPPGLRFSSGDWLEQSLSRAGCAGQAVEDGEPCSGALRTSRCFKRSKMLLNGRSGFCLEQRRSNFPSSITAVNQLGVCCELKLRAETGVSSTPKSSPLGCLKFILHLLTRYLELFTFLHGSRGQGHLEVSGWWSLTPIAV